jgi:hypothetical protein
MRLPLRTMIAEPWISKFSVSTCMFLTSSIVSAVKVPLAVSLTLDDTRQPLGLGVIHITGRAESNGLGISVVFGAIRLRRQILTLIPRPGTD